MLFDLSVHLEQEHYLSNEEVKVVMAEMENTYSEVAEAFINDADWSTAVPGLKLGVETNSSMPKVGVLLVGGMYGSQPVGREVLVRLSRHIVEGYKRDDNIVTMILRRADIFILPAVDMAGVDTAKVGTCSFKNHHVMEAGRTASRTTRRWGLRLLRSSWGGSTLSLLLAWRGMGCL